MRKCHASAFDFKFYKGSFYLILLAILFYFFGNFCVPADFVNISESLTEHFQSLFLLFMVFYSYRYAKKVKNIPDTYKFWIWTAFWWLLLFGRGISWGRDFFPEVPRIYYKTIAAILIAIPILSMFFISTIRQEIKRRYLYEKIPVWFVFFAFLFLGLSDVVEHHRIGYEYLVLSKSHNNLIEELFEIPCFFSLAAIVFYLQRQEQSKLRSQHFA